MLYKKGLMPSKVRTTALKEVEWKLTKESREIQGQDFARRLERLLRGLVPIKERTMLFPTGFFNAVVPNSEGRVP
jgi:hypothetical protein